MTKFSGSGGIRTHNFRVTSPLQHQQASKAVLERIPIYTAPKAREDNSYISRLVIRRSSVRIPSEPLNFSNSDDHCQCRLSSLMKCFAPVFWCHVEYKSFFTILEIVLTTNTTMLLLTELEVHRRKYLF